MLKRGSPVQHPSLCCRIPAKFLWEGMAHEWNSISTSAAPQSRTQDIDVRRSGRDAVRGGSESASVGAAGISEAAEGRTGRVKRSGDAAGQRRADSRSEEHTS